MSSELDFDEKASEAGHEKEVENIQREQSDANCTPFEACPAAPGPEAATTHDKETQEVEPQPEDQLPPPPDGGLHAWMKVVGGFVVYINIWGFTLSYGAFQTYYQHDLLSNSSASAISWIGTMQAWLLIMVGVLSGPLFDLGYFRSMLFIGNFLIVLGIMMLSLATEYWQVFLAQGICMGLGAGLLYIPSLALVGIWFDKKRSLALGIVMSGTAVGGTAYIIAFNKLVPTTGFPWTMRTLGFIALALALISFPCLLSGSSILARPRKARSLLDKTALTDPLFLLFTCTTFTSFLGYIVPYFYIAAYAQDRLETSESTALYILVSCLAGSFFGRLLWGYVAQRCGNMITWLGCAVISGIIGFSWIGIDHKSNFIAFSVMWGFFSASLVTLPGSAFPNICPDLSRLGTRLGMSWGISSIATLIGAPIAGALIKTKKDSDGNLRESFLGVQIWTGACLLLGSVWLAVLWAATVRRQKKGWFI